MVFHLTSEVNQDFKEKIIWWYFTTKNPNPRIYKNSWVKFMLYWMIFDAYLTEISKLDLDRKKLEYFCQNKCDFKDCILAKWDSFSGCAAKLKKLSPIQDMRPNSNKMVHLNDENNLKQIFDFVYQIRCNLFHGAKDIKNTRDNELVNAGAELLQFSIAYWIEGD